MLNLQLSHLNRFRLDALRSDEPYLRLEPFSLKCKKLSALREGDWIDLGEAPPALELACDGAALARVFPTREGVRIRALIEREETAGRGRCRIEARLAPLPGAPLREGAELPVAWQAVERIHLYGPEGCFAVAALIRHEKGYALKIEELCRG